MKLGQAATLQLPLQSTILLLLRLALVSPHQFVPRARALPSDSTVLRPSQQPSNAEPTPLLQICGWT